LFATVFATLGLAAQPAPVETRIVPGSPVVSVDLLRFPLTPKIRQRLLKAMSTSDSGDHQAAIGQLLDLLGKYPGSAPFVDNLLGVEYVKISRFEDAVSSLEKAVAFLPRDAWTHYNLGLALICAGDRDRARQEIQRAVELDPSNDDMRARLQSLDGPSPAGN
jgi:Flp pilus assembly protein TadD